MDRQFYAFQSAVENFKDNGSTGDETLSKADRADCSRCNQWKRELLETSPTVQFLVKHVSLLKDPNQPQDNRINIECIKCEKDQSGGFNPEHGIALCHNKLLSKKHMENTLSHELIHAYDLRRFKSIESYFGESLEAQACSEIRASNLSGECHFLREVSRLNIHFYRQHEKCVRRRAVLSVSANPNCESKEQAASVVDRVWKSCFPDTRPFDEVF